MKPRCKIDTWCYTLSNSKSRNKVKRIINKAHRREDKRIINKEINNEKENL